MKKIISLCIFLCGITAFAVENELHVLSQSLDALAQKLSGQDIPKKRAEAVNYDTFKVNTITIHLLQGDITKLQSEKGITVDAIVNAANKELGRGSGVCGAIFKAADIKRQDFLTREIGNRYPHGVEPGDAVITESYGLKSEGIQNIIHAVGPIYNDYKNKKEAADSIKQCLF